jgi:hypothetical protein
LIRAGGNTIALHDIGLAFLLGDSHPRVGKWHSATWSPEVTSSCPRWPCQGLWPDLIAETKSSVGFLRLLQIPSLKGIPFRKMYATALHWKEKESLAFNYLRV